MIQTDLTQYQIDIHDDGVNFCLKLKHKNYYIGQAEGVLNSSREMQLIGIEIFEKPVCVHNFLISRIWRKLLKIKVPDYRGQGLATVLLIALIEYAYEKKVNYIWSSVKPSGGLDGDTLVAWYQRYGFEASSPTDKDLPGALAHIRFDFYKDG